MTFPVIASGTLNSSDWTNTVNHIISLPTGYAAGDLLIVAFNADGSGSTRTITFPADKPWVDIVPRQYNMATTWTIKYRIADGTEGPNISVTTNVAEQTAAVAFRVTGYNATTPILGAASVTSSITGGDSTPNPPNSNPGTAADYLWIEAYGADAMNVTTGYASVDWTGLSQSQSATTDPSGACQIAVAYLELNAAALNPPVMYQSAPEDWSAATFAINPGAGGAPGIDVTVEPNSIGVSGIVNTPTCNSTGGILFMTGFESQISGDTYMPEGKAWLGCSGLSYSSVAKDSNYSLKCLANNQYNASIQLFRPDSHGRISSVAPVITPFGVNEVTLHFNIFVDSAGTASDIVNFSAPGVDVMRFCRLRLNTDLSLSFVNASGVVVATSVSVLSPYVWYWIGIKVNFSHTGTYEVKVDNAATSWLSGTADTLSGLVSDLGTIILGPTYTDSNVTCTAYFDNVVVSTGDFLAQRCVKRIAPRVQANYWTWGGSYTDVNDNPDASATYIDASDPGKSSYLFDTCASKDIKTVDAVQIISRVNAPDAYGSNLYTHGRYGIVSYKIGAIGGDGWGTYGFVRNVSLDGTAWTPAKLDATEFGFGQDYNPTTASRLSNIAVDVLGTTAQHISTYPNIGVIFGTILDPDSITGDSLSAPDSVVGPVNVLAPDIITDSIVYPDAVTGSSVVPEPTVVFGCTILSDAVVVGINVDDPVIYTDGNVIVVSDVVVGSGTISDITNIFDLSFDVTEAIGTATVPDPDDVIAEIYCISEQDAVVSGEILVIDPWIYTDWNVEFAADTFTAEATVPAPTVTGNALFAATVLSLTSEARVITPNYITLPAPESFVLTGPETRWKESENDISDLTVKTVEITPKSVSFEVSENGFVTIPVGSIETKQFGPRASNASYYDVEVHRVSPIVQFQVPEFVKALHPDFITFMELYYAWMERVGNAYNLNKNLLTYQDLDTTLDSYIEYFRKEFIDNIPRELWTNPRTLIKHIKEFYRAKGSEKSYKFLFRIMTNQNISLYYPREDIFKLSDGKWIYDMVMRVRKVTGNPFDLKDQKVIGFVTGAYATVENVYLKQVGFHEVYELYLNESSIHGTFSPGETLYTEAGDIEVKVYPSITSLTITDGGTDYEVGDVVTVKGGGGFGARYKVKTVNAAGAITSFNALEQGLQYSNTIGYLDNITLHLKTGTGSFEVGESVFQGDGTSFETRGIVVSYTPSTNTLVITNVTGTFKTNSSIFGFHSDARCTIESIDYYEVILTGTSGTNAQIVANVGAILKTDGYFLNEDGQLSTSKYFQDSYYYQQFSYAIVIDESLEYYKKIVLELLHPAGYLMFGKFRPVRRVDLGIFGTVAEKRVSIQEVDISLADVSISTIISPILKESSTSFRLGPSYRSIDRFKFNYLPAEHTFATVWADVTDDIYDISVLSESEQMQGVNEDYWETRQANTPVETFEDFTFEDFYLRPYTKTNIVMDPILRSTSLDTNVCRLTTVSLEIVKYIPQAEPNPAGDKTVLAATVGATLVRPDITNELGTGRTILPAVRRASCSVLNPDILSFIGADAVPYSRIPCGELVVNPQDMVVSACDKFVAIPLGELEVVASLVGRSSNHRQNYTIYAPVFGMACHTQAVTSSISSGNCIIYAPVFATYVGTTYRIGPVDVYTSSLTDNDVILKTKDLEFSGIPFITLNTTEISQLPLNQGDHKVPARLKGIKVARWDSTNLTENLLRWSEKFDAVDWYTLGSTVVANTLSDPYDNEASADKIFETVANSIHAVGQYVPTKAGLNYRLSVYAKGIARTKIKITGISQAGSGFSSADWCEFDCNNEPAVTSTTSGGNCVIQAPAFAIRTYAGPTGTAIEAAGNCTIPAPVFSASLDIYTNTYLCGGSAKNASISSTGLAPGWHRLSVEIPSNLTTSNSFFEIKIQNAARADSYAGTVTSGFALWGAQCQRTAAVSTYVKTTGYIKQYNERPLVVNTGQYIYGDNPIAVEITPLAVQWKSTANHFTLLSHKHITVDVGTLAWVLAPPAVGPSPSASPSSSASASPSASASASPSASASASPSASVSGSPSHSASASPSASESASPSASESASPSASESSSPSPSASPSASESASPSASESASPSASESASPSASESASPSASESASPSASESASASSSPSPSASPSASESASPSASESASPSASESASPSASESASPSASESSSPSPSASPSASESASPSASESASPSASESASPSASESASPSASESSSPSPSASPSASESASPSASESASPSASESSSPSPSASPSASESSSPSPSASPSASESASPSASESASPSASESASASASPSASTSASPSASTSASPSASESSSPSPSASPSASESASPSASVSASPSASESSSPSPSASPSASTSASPSASTSASPSASESSSPSPSASPSASTSASPSASVSGSPSASVSATPSASPSASTSASKSASPSASTSSSPSPSASPSASTSASPSASASRSPSASPSASASLSPSASPSASASATPSGDYSYTYPLFTGFEHGAGEYVHAATGTYSFSTAKSKDGTYSLRCNPANSDHGYVDFRGYKTGTNGVAAGMALSTAYTKFDFLYLTKPADADSFERICQLFENGGSVKVELLITDAGTLLIRDYAATQSSVTELALSSDTWYRIEIMTNTNPNSPFDALYEVKVDGTSVLSGSCNQTSKNLGIVRLGKRNLQGNSVDFYYDNLVVCDSDYPGDVYVQNVLPNADGATHAWHYTSNGATGTTYAEVDEAVPDGGTSFIESMGTTNCIHLVAFPASGITETIIAVMPQAKVTGFTTDTASTRLRIVSGSTTVDSTGYDVSNTAETWLKMPYSYDPNTLGGWSAASLQALQVGVVEANAVHTQCTAINVSVLIQRT